MVKKLLFIGLLLSGFGGIALFSPQFVTPAYQQIRPTPTIYGANPAQEVLQANASPTFGTLGPCPSCEDPEISPVVSGGVVPSGSSDTAPTSTINDPGGEDPCETEGASLADHKKKKSKHWQHKGGISGSMEALIKFFIELINLILQLLGGSPIKVPQESTPVPDNQTPEQPDVEEPETPEPCVPQEQPTTAPDSQPSTNPVSPSTSAAPSAGVSPSVIPSGAPNTSKVPVGSKVVFVGDYNTGNFGQWGTCQWKGRNSGCSSYNGQDYMAAMVNDGPGHETAARFEVRSGDEPDFGGERAEVRAGSAADVAEGDERWYELSLKFPTDFQNPEPWFIVMQWHAGSGSPPLALQVGEDGVLKFSNDRTGKTTAIGPIQKGKWVDYVLHVKFSSSSSALAESWVNGAKQAGIHKEANMASGSNYLKMGIYRGSQSATHVVLHDGLRITAP